MKNEWIIWRYHTPAECYYTLMSSQDQMFNTAVVNDGIYRQRMEKVLSQDQIRLTIQNTQWDFDLGYFYNRSKGVGI